MATAWWGIRQPWQECVQIDEFGGGSHDACGTYAIENLRANYLKRAPSYGGGEAIRARMIANKGFTPGSGTTLVALRDEIEQREQGNLGGVVSFLDWQSSTLMADQVHAALAHEVGVIFEVHNAAALPSNEPGVQNHFVVAACYGGDATPLEQSKVYILNSDYAAWARTSGPQQGQWMTVADFLKADPRGYIVVAPPVPATPPPPPPPAAPDIAGATVDLTQIQQLVQKYVADALAKLKPGG